MRLKLLNSYLLLLIIMMIASGARDLIAQDDTQVLNKWMHYTDSRNSLYHHLADEACDLLKSREGEISSLTTVVQWQERQKQMKQTLVNVLGGFPKKTPLNPQVTAVVKKDGYTLENVIYESQPNFFVTASLFIPERLKGKAPAILFCPGHKDLSYRKEFYQQVILNLVKKGFVVLAIDPIGQGERLQYCNPATNKSKIGWSTKEHSYPSVQVSLIGKSVARYFIWDGIRGIDYLVSRKEVDPKRIGVHGISGGGTQTAYISALDDRVAAAAPACFITSYSRLFESIGVQDGEQNLYHAIKSGIDHADFIELRAPKPSLLMTTTNDFFSIQGVRETYDEVKHVYTILGKPENLTRVEDDYGHGYTQKNREALYAFFQKHLNQPGSPKEEEVEYFTIEELQKTKTGQVATSLNAETVFSLNRKETEDYIHKLQKLRKEDLAKHLKGIPASAKLLSGYREPSQEDIPVFIGRTTKDEGYSIEKYFIKGEGDYVVPYLLFVPERSTDKAIIFLHPEGKEGVVKEPIIIDLINDGYTVIAPDLLGTGELGGYEYKGDAYINNISYNISYMAMLSGRSIVGIQASDVVKLSNILTKLKGLKEVSGIARGEMSPTLLHATAFDSSISEVALFNPYSSYQSFVENEFYESRFIYGLVPGALTAYDLPDLAASLAPKKLLISGMTNAQGNINEDAKSDIEVVNKAYDVFNAASKLEVVKAGTNKEEIELIREWLKK